MFPQACCGIEKIIPVQLDLVVRFGQECAITGYDAVVRQKRGNHVNKIAPRHIKESERKDGVWFFYKLTITVPEKRDVK